MSHNTNKINPFYIQDDEEAWDDDYGDDEYGFEDYDDEQVMLINGSGGMKNRRYNDASAVSHVDRRHHHPSAFGQAHHSNNFSRSYQDGRYDMHDRHRQHRPQVWKYGVILFAVMAVVVFGSSMSSESNGKTGNNVSLSALMEEIPNDEYRIVVLGERHSGTVWMIERLRECFPNVEVSTNLQRMGFFFQDDEATARSKDEALDNPHHNYEKDTIVVHVTLNIYDWLEQMRLSPEYAPDHVGTHKELGHVVPLGWEEFLSKPWTTERPPTDLPLANETGPVCQMAFHYNEVVSCAKTAGGIGDPMYELRPGGESGDPFESIIDLRAAKLKNHHSVQESWPSVKKMIQVSYETTAQDFKTKLLSEILEFTGWNGGSYDNDGVTLPCSGNVLPPSLDSSNEMTLEFVEYVTTNADWYTEEAVASYVPWTQSDIAAKGIRPAAAVSDEDKDDETKKDGNDDGKGEAEEEQESPADESPPSPSSESNEEKPETNANDNDAESSSSSSENAQDDVKTETKDASDSSSSTETETIESTEENESPPPPKEKESSSEEKSESSTATEEEATEHSDESISDDKTSEQKDDEPKTDSTASTSDETEEKEPSSAKSSDKNEETDATGDAPSANAKEASDASDASKSETVQEDAVTKEQEATPDVNAESKEEVVAAETNEENKSDKEKPPTAEVSDNEDEFEGDKETPDQEEQTAAESDIKSADETQSGTETETSATEPEEASTAAANDAQSESDEKDGER